MHAGKMQYIQQAQGGQLQRRKLAAIPYNLGLAYLTVPSYTSRKIRPRKKFYR